MVTYELEQKEHQKIFLNLGTILILMKEEITIDGENEQNAKDFLTYFDKKNWENLFEVAKKYNLQDELRDPLKEIGEMKFIQEKMENERVYIDIDKGVDNIFAAILGHQKYSHQLFKIFKDANQQIFDEYASNIAFKQEIVQKLLEKNLELSKISPNVMQNIIFELPILRQLILVRMIDKLIETKQKVMEELSFKLRKILLFKLIYILLSDSQIDEAQKSLLETICKKIDIDNEYIDEFTVLAYKLNSVSTEIDELINE